MRLVFALIKTETSQSAAPSNKKLLNAIKTWIDGSPWKL